MTWGRIEGVVRDASGATLDGAGILALGAALAMVHTDGQGRFSLQLPPGRYILHVMLGGYLPGSRGPVRVSSDSAQRWSITLGRVPDAPASLAAGAEQAVTSETKAGSADPESVDHAHSETAWRLRHLPRTVLRDQDLVGGSAPAARIPAEAWGTPRMSRTDGRGAPALADLGFQGQVNFLATSAWSATGHGVPSEDWGRGVAYLVVGAPVGSRGDWSVRAAMAPGERASWVFQGEYRAHRDRSHAFRAGVSHSALAEPITEPDRLKVGTTRDVRRVSGVYGYDRWTRGSVSIDYGLKVSRYDYLAEPALASARLALETQVIPGVSVRVGASPRMVAPGAEQFLPPAAAGAWLPPERTFDAVGGSLVPERIEDYEVGVRAQVTPTLLAGVRGFSEASGGQIATVFGLDETAGVGHYHVGRAGTVVVRGVAVVLSGQFAAAVTGRVAYTRTRADWEVGPGGALAAVAPGLVRHGREWGHELATEVDARLEVTATDLRLAWRLSNLFPGETGRAGGPRVGGRFNVEVRQQLPYRPLPGSEVNLLVAARTLLRDPSPENSFYDELLTVAPPLQVLCGIQMRF